jgi:hypothetical protein
MVFETPDGDEAMVLISIVSPEFLGKTRADGSMIQGELDAINDLEGAGVLMRFTPYDR